MRIRSIILTAIVACCLPHAALARAPVAMAVINGTDMLVFEGIDPVLPKDRHEVTFKISASSLSLGGWFRLLSTPKTAIVFDGEGLAGRRCPFFNLEDRAYEIVEVRPLLYRITAATESKAEIRQAEKSGCIITTRPDFSKIRQPHDEYNHNQ